MKNKLLPLFASLALTLSSCSLLWTFSFDHSLSETEEKTIPVYALYKMVEDGAYDIAQYKTGEKKIHVSNEFVGMPFLSLSEYADLLSLGYLDGCSHRLSGSRQQSYVAMNQEETPVYQVVIDYSTGNLYHAGSLSTAMKTGADLSKSSIEVGSKTEYEVPEEGNGFEVANVFNGQLPVYKGGNDYYLPLAVLDAQIGADAGLFHYYTPDAIYEYSSAADLSVNFALMGEESCVYQGWKDYIDEHKELPLGIALGDYDSLSYTFNHLYGMMSQKYPGRSFARFLEENGLREDLLSTDIAKHLQSVISATGILDDDHTGVTDFPFWWNDKGDEFTLYRGKNSISRSATRKLLLEKKEEIYETEGISSSDIRYSNDGKLAMVSFDSFSVSLDAFEADGKTLKEDIANEDTYYYLLDKLNTLSKNSSVDKVVLDLSTNGGGTIGIMFRMLALISKSNLYQGYVWNSNSKMITKVATQIDSNGDGIYDSSDTFGNRFDFYLLTSDASFSCGNAFPYYAKKLGIAKTIGKTSGGGECLVGSSALPSGIGLAHSSNNHMGWYKNKEFEGDEEGVTPDFALEYDEFYDLEAIEPKLK